MKIPLVDLKEQYKTIKGEVDRAIESVMEDTAFVLGENVRRFEEAFADYCGTRHAVGVGSGTSALHLALRVCGIGEGDEVITVPNTFFATAEAIVHTGARVVFADVDPGTLNIDVEKVRAAITRKTKAVIPVHLFGHPADMEGIMEVAGSAGIDVIEDAAQAHGALYDDRRVGSVGRAGCFSFYPGKNLGAYGEGGAVVTNDEKVAEGIRTLRDHGRMGKCDHGVIGYNERLDGLQAAILRVKLGHLEEWNESRRRIAELYSELLEDIPSVFPVRPLKGTTPVHHLYVIRVEQGSRDELKQHLFERGVMAGIHYPVPLHQTTALGYLGHQPGDFPVAEEAAARILSLPIFPEMKVDQVEYVVNSIGEYVFSQEDTGVGTAKNVTDLPHERSV